MPERPPIPEDIWARLQKLLADVKRGEWSGGAQVVLNVSPQGVVTSCEFKGRMETRK